MLPINPLQFDIHGLVMLIINVKKKKIIFVTLDGKDQKVIKSDPNVALLCDLVFKICSYTLDPSIKNAAFSVNTIMVPRISEEIAEFLKESTP